MIGITAKPLRYGLIGLAFSVGAVALAAQPSRAQGDYDDRYAERADDGVTITAPRHRTGEYGAPIEWVSTHRVVRFYDLDSMYPVKADDSPDCYGMAMDRARDDVVDQLGHAPLGW